MLPLFFLRKYVSELANRLSLEILYFQFINKRQCVEKFGHSREASTFT